MSRIAYILMFLIGGAVGQGTQVQQSARVPTRIVSRRYGFSMETPTGWRASITTPGGLPLLINFDWKELQGKSGVNFLPKGGAMIAVQSEDGLPQPNGSYSLDEWADFDERSASSEAMLRDFEMPTSTGVDRALSLSFDGPNDGSDIQQQHDVNVYWQFHGHRFATRLTYAVGDPNGKAYVKTLETLVRSIRPVAAPGGR